MYYYHNGDNTFHQYSLSTAWDINSAKYEKYGEAGSAFCNAFFISVDGVYLYEINNTTSTVTQRKMLTPWDISTVGHSVSSTELDIESINFSTDGTIMFQSKSNYIYQQTLSTAWDITTAGATTSTYLNDGDD